MSRTIYCVQCGVPLNLPDHAAGRRLKCPKCGVKFQAPGEPPKPPPGPGASQSGVGRESTIELARKPSSVELPVMPTAPGDLRETFDLPMMTEADTTPARGAKAPASSRAAADALTLFNEPAPAPRPRKGAEARASARRCPTCGGVVPVGMSICQTCGLDLETGMRVGLDDDLAPPPPPPSPGLPIVLTVVGAVCAALSLAGVIASVLSWERGGPYFLILSGFGIYASIQFLRQKSVRLLLVALSLGALINSAFLIGLPIYEATSNVIEVELKDKPDDPNFETVELRGAPLDTQKLTAGIAILFLYAVVSIYLLSPTTQRNFRK